MKNILTFILFACTFNYCNAQEKWAVSADIFYASYNMSDLKDLLDGSRSSTFQPRVTDNFPGYIGYTAQVSIAPTNRIRYGLRYQYTSTGGRTDYGDYSGRITQDLLLHSSNVGLSVQVPLLKRVPDNPWALYASFAAGISFTNMTAKYHSVLLDTNYEELAEFHSINYFGNPALQLEREIFGPFSAYIYSGYEFQIHGSLKADGGTLVYRGKKSSAEWDGFRAGVGVMMKL